MTMTSQHSRERMNSLVSEAASIHGEGTLLLTFRIGARTLRLPIATGGVEAVTGEGEPLPCLTCDVDLARLSSALEVLGARRRRESPRGLISQSVVLRCPACGTLYPPLEAEQLV